MIIKNPQFTIKPQHQISITKAAALPGPGGEIVAADTVVSIVGEFDVQQYLIDDIKAEIADYRATVEDLLQTLHAKKVAAQAKIDEQAPKP